MRTIRSGANIDELASMETTTAAIKNVFSILDSSGYVLRLTITSFTDVLSRMFHLYMLISYEQETKLMDAGDAPRMRELSAHDFPGIVRDVPTLEAKNIRRTISENTALAVQVTSKAAVLFNVQSGIECARWVGAITTASVSGNSVCLALQGGRVVTLKVDVEASKFVVE